MTEGDFGKATFMRQKKGFSGRIVCYGVIKMIDKEFILFQDNDDFPYLIDKKDIEFEKEDFKQIT
jgi:hypothetical protein